MIVLNILWFAATFALVFYLPGRLVVDRWLAAPDPEELFPVSLGIGVALVGTLATLIVGVVGLFWSGAIVTPLVLWGIGLGTSLLVGLTGERPLVRPRRFFTRPTRTQAGLWALALGGLLFFSVHYDDDLLREDGPLLILVSSTDVGILGVHTHPSIEGPDAGQGAVGASEGLLNEFSLLSGWDGEALGPGIIPSTFVPLFGGFGLRLTYALAGLLLPGLGFVLGRSLFRRTWAAWGTALLLAFSPWALEIRTFDKNFMASVFGTLALVLLFRARPAALLAGLAAGFFLGVHHVEVFVVPVVLWYLWRLGREGAPGVARRDPWRFLGGLVLGVSPCLFLHVLFPLWHGGTLVENFYQRPPAPHSFLGIEFDSPLLLNYPFHDELVRSPYHAYPPIVAYPLDFLARFGLLLTALVPAGLAWFGGREQRRRTLVLASWVVPLMAILLVQSNWVDPNKMGLPAMAAAPLVLLVVGGAVWLADRTRSWIPRAVVAAVGIALPLAAGPALRAWDGPVDDRVWEFLDEDDGMESWSTMAHHADETAAYVALDRALFEPCLLPSARADHGWDPAVLARSAGQLANDLRNPSLRERRNAMSDFLRLTFWGFGVGIAPLRALHAGDPQPSIESWPEMSPVDPTDGGDSAIVWVDLAESPILAEQPVAPGPVPDGVEPLLTRQPPVAMVSGFDAPWAPPHGATLLAGRDRLGNVFLVVGPGQPNPRGRPDWLSVDERSALQFPDRRVPVRVPRGAVIRIIELRSYFPAVWYSRFAIVEDDGQGGVRVRFTRGAKLSPA